MFEALIAKLEAAVEWDAALDQEIEDLIDNSDRRLGWGPYPYTSKIDAARGLLDRMLPGWSYRVARCSLSDDAWVIPDFNCPIHGERLRAEFRQDIDWSDLTDVDLRPSGREATALCISILKALEIINAKSHQAPEETPAEAGVETWTDSKATTQAEIGTDGERAQEEDEAVLVDLRSIFENCEPEDLARAALDAEREIIAQEARRHSGFYPEASDGRNTFILFAEFVERRQEVPLETYTIGENTMACVFKPSGLTNLHDLQAVLDAVEKALSPSEAVARNTDQTAPYAAPIFSDRFMEDLRKAAEEEDLPPVEPEKSGGNPMRFFADNVDSWGALEWFDRMVDACEDHDRKRVQEIQCSDREEANRISLSADTSKMIMSSSAFCLAREHKDAVRDALSSVVEPKLKPEQVKAFKLTFYGNTGDESDDPFLKAFEMMGWLQK